MSTPHLSSLLRLLLLTPVAACELAKTTPSPPAAATTTAAAVTATVPDILMGADAAWTPGVAAYDVTGAPMQAAGGSAVRDSQGMFYLFGNATHGLDVIEPYDGIRVYRSTDWAHWQSPNIILTADDLANACAGVTAVLHPKVVYNSATQRYVLFALARLLNTDVTSLLLATAPAAGGPYGAPTCLTMASPRVRELAPFVDTDGAGYIIYAADDGEHLDGLQGDYLGIANPNMAQGANILSAPSIMRLGQRYTLLFSADVPGPASSWVAQSDTLADLLTAMPRPLTGETPDHYGAHLSYVMPLQDGALLCADAWDGNLDHAVAPLCLPIADNGRGPTVQYAATLQLIQSTQTVNEAPRALRIDPVHLVAVAGTSEGAGDTWRTSAGALAIAGQPTIPAGRDKSLSFVTTLPRQGRVGAVMRYCNANAYTALWYDRNQHVLGVHDGATDRPLVGPLNLPTPVLLQMTLAGSWATIAANGMTVFAGAIGEGSCAAGQVGVYADAPSEPVTVTNLRWQDVGLMRTVETYQGETVETFVQPLDHDAWLAEGTALIGPATSTSLLVDANAAALRDVDIRAVVNPNDGLWGLVLRYETPQRFIALTFNPVAGRVSWFTPDGSGGLLAPVAFATDQAMPVAVRVAGSGLTVSVNGHDVYAGAVPALPDAAGAWGLWAGPGAGLVLQNVTVQVHGATAGSVAADAAEFVYSGVGWQGLHMSDGVARMRSCDANDTMQLAFVGRAVTLRADVSASGGEGLVTIDGIPLPSGSLIDTYVPAAESDVTVAQVQGLAFAQHVLAVSVLGTHNPRASSACITLTGAMVQ